MCFGIFCLTTSVPAIMSFHRLQSPFLVSLARRTILTSCPCVPEGNHTLATGIGGCNSCSMEVLAGLQVFRYLGWKNSPLVLGKIVLSNKVSSREVHIQGTGEGHSLSQPGRQNQPVHGERNAASGLPSYSRVQSSNASGYSGFVLQICRKELSVVMERFSISSPRHLPAP